MFVDDNQDANPVDPSTTENETQNNAEGQQTDSSQVADAQAPPSQQQDANPSADAGSGLPPKDNLYGEFRRKIFEEMMPLVQGAVRESMLGMQGQQATSSQPQTQEVKYQGKYGKAELESILRHPDANEHDKMFANRGLAYIESKEDILREIDTRTEKQASQTRQGQALQGIITDYPQVFNRQANQWNFADPLFQKAMQLYNANDRLRAFGNEGLRVAMDQVYAQMAREGQVQVTKQKVKLNTQQRQIDKNQSQALSAGSLAPVRQSDPKTVSRAKLMEAYKNNPDDPALRTAALKPLIPKSWLE